MATRLEEIQNIIDQMPDDPFPRYGLALEHKNLGQLEEAQKRFADLMARHPDYVPQYLMYGGLLVQMKRADEARAVFTKGIEVAGRAKNQHALGELQQALAGIEGAGDPDED